MVFWLEKAGMGWLGGAGWRRVEVMSYVQKARFL
jgi:hypothetical protein